MEFCDISVGRGTDSPFELLGAPYIDGAKFSAEMNRLALPGIGFVPVKFTPTSSVFSGKECGGVRMVVGDRAAFHAVETGVALASVLHRLYGKQFGVGKMLKLLGNKATLSSIESGVPPAEMRAGWDAGLQAFMERRKPFLMYPR